MMKYIIQYTLPYEHRVMVGIEADNPEAAITRAGELFDQGDIWNDTAETPLLFDDFEETSEAGLPLKFTVVNEVDGEWPEPEVSVKAIRRRDAAFLAARLLVDIYQSGEDINRNNLEPAYCAALNATSPNPKRISAQN